MKIVFDIEANGLLYNATKIRCLCYRDIEKKESGSITDYQQMRDLLLQPNLTLIGHKIITYDVPVLEKILNIKIDALLVDTLTLSWYLETERLVHGLEQYGEEYGIPKPVIEAHEWEGPADDAPQGEKDAHTALMIHRCTEDVKINCKVWHKQDWYLHQLYEDNESDIRKCLKYFQFKMLCMREQEEIGLNFNEEKARKNIEELSILKDAKIKELESAMPKVPIKGKKTYPKVIKKKDGSTSADGEKWFGLLKQENLPEDHTGEVEFIKGYAEPNAGSHEQIKSWLYSLGWVPENIKFDRNKKTGEIKKIPQVGSKEKDGSVCPSVKKLFEQTPELELLEGLSILSHRISVFNGFLNDQVNGRLYPTCSGLTNTLRFKQKVLVNLPGTDKKYGEQIRGCIIADEGSVLIGSDLANIEDRTKRHYIYRYDPDYVNTMSIPGYDAHLELGILAGFFEQEDADFFKEISKRIEKEEFVSPEETKRFKKIKADRHKAKTTNFAATYKVGAATLSRNSGLPLNEAAKLIEIYWKRNKAILDVENSLKIKSVGGHKWLLNPISGLYYSLRADKDKFSTLNQGTAVWCFDVWLSFIKKAGLKIPFQYHDELLRNAKNSKEEIEHNKKMIQRAITLANEYLKLNVQIGCSVEIGPDYASCH